MIVKWGNIKLHIDKRTLVISESGKDKIEECVVCANCGMALDNIYSPLIANETQTVYCSDECADIHIKNMRRSD